MLRNSLIILLASLFSTLSIAGTQTFDMTTLSDGDTSCWCWGNTLTFENIGDDNIDLVISGWADTGDNDTIESGVLKFYGNSGNGTSSLGLINRHAWGYGGNDENEPEHSVDGINDFEAILLEFSEAVDLTQFGIGWAYDAGYGQADISVLAYTNDDADYGTTGHVSGQTWGGVSGILSQGWESIDNYSNVGANDYQSVTTEVTSKYWLIGAYNSAFGSIHGSDGNDGFKLKSLQTSYTKPPSEKPPGIPEPSMFALFALGLFSLARVHKGRDINL